MLHLNPLIIPSFADSVGTCAMSDKRSMSLQNGRKARDRMPLARCAVSAWCFACLTRLTSPVRQVRSGLDFWIHTTGIEPRCLAAVSKGKHPYNETQCCCEPRVT